MSDDMQHVTDLTLYQLAHKYPDMLEFYQRNWQYDPIVCQFSAPEGIPGYFQTMNGPWRG